MTEIHPFIKIFTCDPLKYKMDNSILNVSMCMGKSTRMKRVNNVLTLDIIELLIRTTRISKHKTVKQCCSRKENV